MYHAFYEQREFTTDDICLALNELIPLAQLGKQSNKKITALGLLRSNSRLYPLTLSISNLNIYMKQRFFRSLADLRFAIAILLIIASFSIIGTVIEQDQSIEVYKLNYPLTNKVFGFLSWDIIIKFGFDHVYKTWWFITALVLFGLSLLTCTILQQLPGLRISRRCQFFRNPQQFQRLKVSTQIKNSNLQKLVANIKQTQYSVFHQRNIIYAYKGLIGRIAPIIVHFSMILILIGTVLAL